MRRGRIVSLRHACVWNDANPEAPGVDICIMFSKVRDQVLARTNNAQEPFTYGSLPGQQFYFKQAVAR